MPNSRALHFDANVEKGFQYVTLKPCYFVRYSDPSIWGKTFMIDGTECLVIWTLRVH